MADISEYTKIIKDAIPGETVRDAFIEILRILNTIGGDVGSLNGHPASYFATSVEYANARKKIFDVINDNYDEKPLEHSKKLLTSGVIWEAVDAVDSVLENLNNYETPIDDLVENIKHIENAKEEIRKAIYNKSGGRLGKKNQTNFTLYDDYIKSLVKELDPTMKSITIGELDNNKLIDANEKENPQGEPNKYYAYNEVSVNVKHKVTSLNPSVNDSYSAKAGTVGYNKVSIKVSTSAGSGRTGGSGGGSQVDENGIANNVTLTTNGVHDASGYSVNGWRTVIVDVEDPDIDFDATYTVTFFDSDETTVIGDSVKGIPYNGRVAEDLIPTPPDKPGLYFIGWDPAPYNIRIDTDCIAKYSDVAPSVGQIPDSWEIIVANRGREYADGSYKTLLLNDNLGEIRMQKVCSGENGTTSTWVAMDCLRQVRNFDSKRIQGWSESSLRTWLNEDFYLTGLPEVIRDNIVDVEKVSYEHDYHRQIKFQTVVHDKVWIPSLTEILGDISSSDDENMAVALYQQLAVSGRSVSLSPDTVINELKGVHYKNVYPTSTVTVTPGSNLGILSLSRQPSDTTKCVKTLGNGGSANSWYTRTVAYETTGHNSNDRYPVVFAFNSSGELTTASTWHMTPYPARSGIVIGFCL